MSSWRNNRATPKLKAEYLVNLAAGELAREALKALIPPAPAPFYCKQNRILLRVCRLKTCPSFPCPTDITHIPQRDNIKIFPSTKMIIPKGRPIGKTYPKMSLMNIMFKKNRGK